MSAIQLRQLTRRYGRRLGVEAIDLTVPEGSIFGFVGPNGAGKSTTIRILLGLLRPTRGQAAVFGLDCWKKSHHIKREVGYLPGDLRLYPWMDGWEALRFAGRARGRDLLKAGETLAEEFQLDLRVRVRSMSRGMRQKLGLILALAHEPRLLILDEPASGLDPLMQELMEAHLRGVARRGRTVFFSSHTLSEVERLCDRVAILREGRVVADDALADLRSRAAREVTIRWREGATGAPPPREFLALRERSALRWSGTLTGQATELLQWLARQPVEDFTLGEPDLESLFRKYYRQGGGR